MRADMGGAACTVGALYTVAKLKVPTHIKGMRHLITQYMLVLWGHYTLAKLKVPTHIKGTLLA